MDQEERKEEAIAAAVNTNDDVHEANDPVNVLRRRAKKKLESIDIVTAEDIIEAFKDKDEAGRFTTCTEIKEDYWEPESKKIVRSRSKCVTMSAQIYLESSGDFTTLVFQFPDKNHIDITRMWNVLTEYGKKSEKIDNDAREVPVLTFSTVPMILGGRYGMYATDPVFWCLQPSLPVYDGCDQIRILFQPDSVLFLRDDSFESDEVIRKVRNELASKRFAEEMRLAKEEEEAAFRRAKEAEIAEYLENNHNNQHTFKSSRKDGD